MTLQFCPTRYIPLLAFALLLFTSCKKRYKEKHYGIVSGRMVYGPDKKPVAGMEVSVDGCYHPLIGREQCNERSKTVTDADGKFYMKFTGDGSATRFKLVIPRNDSVFLETAPELAIKKRNELEVVVNKRMFAHIRIIIHKNEGKDLQFGYRTVKDSGGPIDTTILVWSRESPLSNTFRLGAYDPAVSAYRGQHIIIPFKEDNSYRDTIEVADMMQMPVVY